MNYILVKQRFKPRLARRGFTQESIAEKIGVTPSAVSNWLSEPDPSGISIENLHKLASALECNWEWLVGLEEEMALHDAPTPGNELESWRHRAKVAEKKLADLRAGLRSLLDLSSNNPVSLESDLVKVLTEASDLVDAKLGSPEPGQSPSGEAAPPSGGASGASSRPPGV